MMMKLSSFLPKFQVGWSMGYSRLITATYHFSLTFFVNINRQLSIWFPRIAYSVLQMKLECIVFDFEKIGVCT